MIAAFRFESQSDRELDGNWNCGGAKVRSPLHHDMASALTDNLEIVLFEDTADVSSGKDAEFTHGPLRSG